MEGMDVDSGASFSQPFTDASTTSSSIWPTEFVSEDTDSDTGVASQEQMVDFPQSNFDSNGDDRVFETWSGMPSRPFRWTAANVNLTSISLVRVTGDGPSEENFRTLRNLSFDASSSTSDFFSALTDTAVELRLDAFGNSDADLKYGDILAIELEWEHSDDDSDGRSVSGFFTVASPTADTATLLELQDSVMGFDFAADGFEVDNSASSNPAPNSDDSDITNEGDGNTSGGGDTTKNAPDTTVIDTNPAATTTAVNGIGQGDNSGSSSSASSGGLSSGAIAGIVIGAVAFVALIALAAWFLLRRRRKTQTPVDDNGIPYPTSNVYAAAKLDSSGADDVPSPHSPYDDNSPVRQEPMPPVAQRDVMAEEPRAESPPTGPTTRNYAHLVEEGMTEQDIRRLEEEERQLDDEIERARGR